MKESKELKWCEECGKNKYFYSQRENEDLQVVTRCQSGHELSRVIAGPKPKLSGSISAMLALASTMPYIRMK